jgi:hypothetical protein
MSRTETQAFFEAYRDAFNRLDGDAVADLWHGRSAISSTGRAGAGSAAELTWWSEDAPMRHNHRALCEVYRGADYGRADFVIEAHVPMGADHAFAHLHWTLQRRDGSALQQFHTGYQLLRTAHGPRVLLAVAHEERLSEMKPHAAQ